MIVDAHVHIGREDLISPNMLKFMQDRHVLDNGGTRRLTAEGLIDEMDANGIEKSVVFPLSFPHDAEQLQVMNAYTLECVQKYSKRLFGFAVVDPDNIPASVKNLEQTVKPNQLMGIKIHPSMQHVFINDPNLDAVYEFASQAGVPVLFHTGAGPGGHTDKFSQPILVEDILMKHATLKVILAHVGRPFYEEVAFILRKYTRAYADVSANMGRKGGPALLRHCMLFLQVYAGAAERLFFGTDYPIFSYQDYLPQMRAALEGGEFGGETITYSPAEIEGILGNNILKLLGVNA